MDTINGEIPSEIVVTGCDMESAPPFESMFNALFTSEWDQRFLKKEEWWHESYEGYLSDESWLYFAAVKIPETAGVRFELNFMFDTWEYANIHGNFPCRKEVGPRDNSVSFTCPATLEPGETAAFIVDVNQALHYHWETISS